MPVFMYDKDGRCVVRTLEKVRARCGVRLRGGTKVMLMEGGVVVTYEFRAGGSEGGGVGDGAVG